MERLQRANTAPSSAADQAVQVIEDRAHSLTMTEANIEAESHATDLRNAESGCFELETALTAVHPARIVWSYVQQVDFLRVRTMAGGVTRLGPQPSADMRVIFALWLYACIEGVGSANRVVRLSETHQGFRWLRRSEDISREMLSDFRWRAAVVVDRQLIEGVVSLWSEGMVSIASLDNDCVRIRASRVSNFRRLTTLGVLLSYAEERIARLRQEVDAEPTHCRGFMRALG